MENNPVLEKEQELEEKDNIIDFKKAKENIQATAGKEPPDRGNWLATLDEGCKFLAIDQGSPYNYLLHEFFICDKRSEDAIQLYLIDKDEAETKLWVVPIIFSRRFILVNVLEEKD